MNTQTRILTNFHLNTGFPEQDINKAAIVVSGKHITAVGDAETLKRQYQAEETDLQGLTVSPGFVDLQLNGCGGVNLNNDISTETLDTMHACNLRFGCTSFLPTLITCSDRDMRKAIAVVGEYSSKHPERVPGIHLEGPYLNPVKKGIHDEGTIREPSAEMIDFICRHAHAVSMVTLAPEMCEPDAIRQLCDAGIIVSMGHTNATCEQARAGEKAGVSFATHLHNAMTPLNSRAPGVVGAVFDSQTLGAGIIADGYHLTWDNLRIAHKMMGDRLVLVTDATAAAGTDMPEFEFGGQTIYHRNGKCYGASGSLGGSALTMIGAVTNSIHQGIPVADTIRMATANAARALGKDKTYGRIAAGQFANLAIYDNTYTIRGHMSGGELSLCQP